MFMRGAPHSITTITYHKMPPGDKGWKEKVGDGRMMVREWRRRKKQWKCSAGFGKK